jgi:hypothetical protein
MQARQGCTGFLLISSTDTVSDIKPENLCRKFSKGNLIGKMSIFLKN